MKEDNNKSSKISEKSEFYVKCHDCGQFLKKDLWVPKNHRWKKHALCIKCLSDYDY